jgi:hypothetical protein
VESTEDGLVQQPADLLDKMRERFMTHDTRSPFDWASQLRMYGKKVRGSTTCLGYIDWSDDGECISYKELRHSYPMFAIQPILAILYLAIIPR